MVQAVTEENGNGGAGDGPASKPPSKPPAAVPESMADADTSPGDPTLLALAERDRLRDQLLRTAADYDNFRKRSRRENEEAERRGKEDTLRELLPVIDNLERAVAASGTAVDAKAVADGVRMVLKSFDDVANRLGLERLRVVGERFDPSLHDAIQQVETDDSPPGTVVHEIAAGYKIGDRLVRPAMVVVARPRPNTNRDQS
jgi:molecular chaperone GrpE